MIFISHCKERAFVSLLLVVLLSLIGCAATKVPIDRQIQLAEGTDIQGRYKTGEVSVVYTFNQTGDTMLLNGKISFQGRGDSLNVRVLFTDAAGLVLDRKLVYLTGYRSGGGLPNDGNFKQKLEVPPGAVGFSFSYSSQPKSGRR